MKRLLYATDLNAHSDRALHRAMMLAIAQDAELKIIHASTAPSSDTKARVTELDAQIRNSELPGLSVVQKAELNYNIDVLEGDPIDQLARTVAGFEPDLVIMGPSSDVSAMNLFYGTSVDQAVARISSPILVVKARPYAHYRNALIAFDHTLGARRALELSTVLAPRASLTLVRAAGQDQSAAELANTRDMVTGHVGLILDAAFEGQHKDVDVDIMVKSGNVGDALLGAAREVTPDLYAFGRTQKSGLKSLLPGSTASLLLGHVTCDALIAGQTP